MAYRLFILLFLCMGFFASPVLAQDTKKKPNPYEKATVTQLEESQSFLKYCEKNKVMSEERDCRCTAAAFLDARMKLGDAASRKDIMITIRNKCYKFAQRPNEPGVDPSSAQDPYFDEVTDAQLQEAQDVYLTCKDSGLMSRYHDCECMASSFLELRLQQGPIPNRDTIMLGLRDKCKNLVDSVGYEYTLCMNDVNSQHHGVDSETYCTCYAKRWVDLFDRAQGTLGLREQVSIKASAQGYCINNAKTEADKREREAEAASQPQAGQ